MTVENQCYVCGKVEVCIDGLCQECTMKEFFNPGAAFAATFGAVSPLVDPEPEPEPYPDPDDVPCPWCGWSDGSHSDDCPGG